MEEFTGRYFSEEIETVYDIVIEDSSLMLKNYQLADDIKLSPGSVDTFSAGYPIAEVDFVRNEAGEITGFNASNGRTRNVYFKKWSDK